MSSQVPQPLNAADQTLVTDLGRVAADADGPPALVYELGRASFALRRLDAALAELVADSALDSAGVRSADDDNRLLSFDAGDIGVELQVAGVGNRLALLGQVLPQPPTGGVVRLESAKGEVGRAELDRVGVFRLDGVSPGLLRLHVSLPGVQPVMTTWVTV